MDTMILLFGEFKNFIGGWEGAAHGLLFAVALCVCFFLGKRERRLLFWPSVLVLVFFFNPFFYKFVGLRFLSGIYWRLLWMLPVSIVTAYALTRVLYRVPKQAVRLLAALTACGCIYITGVPVFSQTTYRERDNRYELPSAVIGICDYVSARLPEWQGEIIVPNELLCDVRQYSSRVCLLYGRNFGGFITEIDDDERAVYDEMSREQPNVSVITEVARNRNCRYIVFNLSFHEIPEDLTGYGYAKVEVIEDIYAIYERME